MDTLSTNTVEETDSMRSGEGEEENEKEKGDSCRKQQTWAPSFYYRTDKQVFHYVGQKIIIEEALDSFAGMIWPAALALCQHLDTHREQLSLVDKAVLEIGAGTGLVSVVASLLGACVTATDLPEVLGNLNVNLSRNTRGRCRHTPQVAALSWGYNLESTCPTSVCWYDYVLAADVVYHHDFLDELLATMKHLCKPGTTLIWANKIQLESDLTFTENFKKAFDTRLLHEDGDMKIFMATCSGEGREGDAALEVQDLLREKEGEEVGRGELQGGGGSCSEEQQDGKQTPEDRILCEEVLANKDGEKDEGMAEEPHISEAERKDKCEEEEGMSQSTGKVLEDENLEEDEKDQSEDVNSSCSSTVRTEDFIAAAQRDRTPAWVPSIKSSFGKDVYHYVGQDILIQESIDSYGAVMWPAALALCSFLDNNRQKVKLEGKEVLELGSGTGLVAIVASLLGASVTATDLPEVLGNLTCNVMRNTRGRCRHMPKVAPLSWSYDLSRTHPASVHRYDYVLAADVVYHHDFLDELLATMEHFCQPGTTLIWANKIRLESDLTFTDNFRKAFDTRLMFEDGDMKIFMASCKEHGAEKNN